MLDFELGVTEACFNKHTTDLSPGLLDSHYTSTIPRFKRPKCPLEHTTNVYILN